MISVLIPVLNYNITELVKQLHFQFSNEGIDFEIICLEDGSSNEMLATNKGIESFSNVLHIVSKENIGRIKARKILCENAKHDWLLFLDADVLPKAPNFANCYIKFVKTRYDAIYGGIAYQKHAPIKSDILRWKYGAKYEQVSAKERNKKPYKVIFSANCLMKKHVFNALELPDNQQYGLDSLIGSKLRKLDSNIIHIDNEVIHLGLESSNTFLKKKEEASEVLLEIYKKDAAAFNPQNSLLKMFVSIKRLRLTFVLSKFHKMFEKKMKKNLLGSSPNMFLFQFYRLTYMCYKDQP